ncbi:MAG: beta-ketoacyl synthase N-terminal-like domain-containing protein [Deltaproteobacteria bacterium]
MPSPTEPIAIVGLGCVFPGAPDAKAFWQNLIQGVDATSEVPEGRWDPVYFDPARPGPDRFYCRRGGFIDAQAAFDPLEFGVMPRAAEGAEPDQLLALSVARAALADAGLKEGAWRERAAVILGRGGYVTAGIARLEQRVRTAEQLVEILRGQLPGVAEAELSALKAAFQAKLGPFGPDTAIGLVPNLAASRIANRLDLQGPAFTVDAACASSLVAVDQACQELRSGRCEVALAGGVHVCHDVTFYSVFTALGALSHAQQLRPFDRRADGLLVGEGAGILVLKRLADARRDGDRIYAQILGLGLSSDGRGAALLNPHVDGQLLALRRAWEMAGVAPDGVGLVEAHGTGTVQGDLAELTTLARFFGPPGDGPRGLTGSVKSMIGHAMPAAGAAGLIKAALALHHGIVPPSLHCEEPHPALAATRFRVPLEAEPWPELGAGPRRAAVNAFGFGGINAHAVLAVAEVAPKRRRRSGPGSPEAATERWLTLAAPDPAALLAALDGQPTPGDYRQIELRQGTSPCPTFPTQRIQVGRGLVPRRKGEFSDKLLGASGPWRLALADPTPERRALARKIVLAERPWHGHDDIWFSPRGTLHDGGKVAFLFPGLEPTFEPRVRDVAEWLGREPPAETPNGLEEMGLAVVATSRLLFEALARLRLVPDALAGHSIGEWTGMVASELIPPMEANAFIDSLVPGQLEVPDVLFAAAGCSAAKAEEAMEGLPDIGLSHDNCPHQVVLCGRESSIETALVRLREARVLAQKLPFRSGFHSPLFAPYLGPHREQLAGLPLATPRIPLWSATRCAPYPRGVDEIRALAAEHLVRPVRFRELLLAMHDQGFRLFVEVGAGGTLTAFAQDSLKGRPHLALSANVKQRSGLAQLRRLCAAAFCEGAAVDLALLSPPASSAARPLDLGVPLVRLPRLLTLGPATPIGPSDSPVLAELHASLESLARAQSDVVAAFSERGPSDARAPPPDRWSERRRLSIEALPFLLDHCFYRQPEGWPDLSDRFPVVPMTLSLDWLREAAGKLLGAPARSLEDIVALRWLPVAPPVEVTLRASRLAPERAQLSVQVSIDGYAQAMAHTGAPPRWEAPAPLTRHEPLPVAAASLYEERWMFHGPSYRGIRAITAYGPDGIDGELVALPAPGALLDNAGQLFGLWVMLHTTVDRLALPFRLGRVSFFAPEPRPDERLTCAVRIRALEPQAVTADLWLSHADGRPYCRIEAWEDRRFDSDERLWELLRFPEKSLLALPRPSGYLLVEDSWTNLPSRELIARRFLGARERAALEALPPRRQGHFLNGRIAVKDAVRELLWRQGAGPLHPVEIQVENDPAGRPWVTGPFTQDVRVSLAHIDGAAVALAAVGVDVGIDLERPSPRPEGFKELVLSPDEQRLLPPGDDWTTRAFCAKEAVAKARGSGLRGDPRRFPLEQVDGQRLRIDGEWAETVLDGPFLIAWRLPT